MVGQIKTDGKVIISTKLDNSGLKAGLKGIPSALSGLKSALSGIGSAIGIAFSVGALINFGKEAINLASDLQEVQNVVDTAFGSMADKANTFAKSAVTSLGMSELSAKQFSSTYMAMGRGMGIAMETSADMAIETTKRIGDVASFYNKSFEEVDTMMKSIWTGETESLKRIGVVMTQTNLQAFALSKGITKNISDLDQATQTQLRYAYVMEQTKLAAGDFARTSNSWANQTRVLSEQWNSFKSVIGTGLIQALTPVIKVVNQLLAALIRLGEKFQEITAKLFGKQTLSAEGSSAADSVTAVADAEEQLAESTDKATKAAKRSLAGFDKLNKLGDDSGSSNSAADVSGLSGSLGNVSLNTQPAEESVGALTGAIDRLKGKLNYFVEWLKGSDFGVAFDNIKSTAGTLGVAFENALEGAKPRIQNSLDGIKTMFGTAGTTIVTVFGGAFKTVTENIDEWTTENQGEIESALSGTIGIITGVTDTISGIVTDVFLIVSKNWEKYGEPIVDWVSEAVLDIHGWLLELYNEILVPILSEALDWVNRIWDENLKGVVDEVIGFVGRIGEWLGILYKEKIKPVVDWIMAYVVPIIKTALSNIQDTVFIVVNYISGTIKNLLKIINGIIDFLVGVFTGDWERAWQGVQGIFEGIKGQFENTINTIKEFFTTRFNAIKDTVIGVFEAIKAAIREKINAMLESVEGMVNGIINGINWLIRKLNSLGTIQLPEILGGGTVGFNLKELSPITIPRLAQGAVIPANREFLAVLGDQKNGRNLELPENLLRQVVREESGGGRHNGIPFIIQVMLNGKVIGEEAVEYVNGVIRKTGKSPIKQGG